MNIVRQILLIAACTLVASLRAGEMKGTVKSVSGDTASVAMEGDVMPPNGTKAEFFFMLGNDEVSVASGTALHIDRGELRVSIQDATGAVEPGHLVRFPGTTRGASANDSGAAAVAAAPSTTPSTADTDSNIKAAFEISTDPIAAPYLSRAGDQYAAGNLDASIATLTAGIKAAPSVGELYLLRGNVYLTKRNKPRAAIADASKALELKVTRAYSAYLIRGVAKGDQGNLKAAIADLNKAIEQKSDFGSAYNNRANYKIGLRDYRGALADSNKAIELRPNTAEPYVNRGYAYAYLGDDASALNDLRRAFELDSSLAKDKQIKAKLAELERKAGKKRPTKNEPEVEDL